tara:strand:- start:194 stop:2062 length:1869 start_codon:yes stop_codon:yes gene_type:complete
MKDNLITEIDRLKGIMGLPLIIEGLPGATANLFNKFFKTSDEASRVLQKIANDMDIADNVVDDIEKIMNDPSLYDNLSLSAKRDVFRVLSGVKGLSDELYDGVLKNFSTSSKELVNRVQVLTDDFGMTYNEAISDIFKDVPEVISLMRTKLRKTEEYKNYISPSFQKKVDNLLVDKKLKLTPDEIEQFNEVVQAKTVKTFAGDIIKYWKKDVEDIKNDAIAYSKGFLEEIKGATKNKERKPLIDAYAVQISRLLDRAEIKMNGAGAKILEDAGVDEELVNKIKFGNEPFFVTYQKIRGKDNQKLYQVMWETSKEFVAELRDLIKGVFRWKGNTIIRAFDVRTSVGQWFYTTQWASLNKLYRLAIKMSPGESQNKMLSYIFATMFASCVGFVFGSLLKGTLVGISQLYGGGLFNKILSIAGGNDGILWGKNVEEWKVELPPTDGATEWLGELGKPLDSIGSVIYKDTLQGFNSKGFKDIFLRLVPGGLMTYPESLAVQLFEKMTPGEDYVPNFRDALLSMVGMGPDERPSMEEMEAQIRAEIAAENEDNSTTLTETKVKNHMLEKYNIDSATLDRYYTMTINNFGNQSLVIGKVDIRWPDGKRPRFIVKLSRNGEITSTKTER